MRRLPPAPVVASPATTCAWCGAALDASAERLAGRTRCAACGAATTDPWPSEDDLEAAYGTWYRPEAGKRFAFGLGDAILGRTRGLLASRIDAIAPDGPVIDVGAGDGTLLDALHRRGREGIGLERNSARPDFRDESLEQIEGDGTWAAIVFWHSLEHLPRPGAAIREAARLLRPGGVIAVAVPNNGSLQAHAFGDEWLHLDLPRHLVHLSAPTLTRGLERAGFRPESTSYARAGQIVIGWLDGLVGMLPGGLDLYQSLRRPEAQSERVGAPKRALTVAVAVALLPVAAACAAAELAVKRGGTVYVEGRLG